MQISKPAWLRVLRHLPFTLSILLLALSLVHCGESTPKAEIPAALDGGWQRGEVSTMDVAQAPESLRRLGVTGGKATTYSHEGRSVPVRLYELPDATKAFEALQTYARTADEYYFQLGTSFVVVEAKSLSNEERRPFLLAFNKASMPQSLEKPKE